jgi:hypothetical protein
VKDWDIEQTATQSNRAEQDDYNQEKCNHSKRSEFDQMKPSERLDNHGNTLTATNAGGGHTILAATSL